VGIYLGINIITGAEVNTKLESVKACGDQVNVIDLGPVWGPKDASYTAASIMNAEEPHTSDMM
jgi:hypothetical protein